MAIEQYRGARESPGCGDCPCAVNGRPKRPVPAFGAMGGLAVIGEGPGTEETLQGYPFVGPSGHLVNKILRENGIERAHLWITNVLLCARPPDDAKLAKAVYCCQPRLREELKDIAPTAILALGATAARALGLQATSVMDARGTVQSTAMLPGVPVITSIHPAAILRGGAGEVSAGKNKQGADAQVFFLAADIVKAYRISKGQIAPIWSDDITVVTEAHPPLLSTILKEAYEWGLLGLDLEWVPDGRITWLGLGTRHRSVSFWFPVLGAPALGLVRAAMEDASLPKLIHNLQADKEVWEREVGPIHGRIEDTMLAHNAAFPGIAHDLQQVASQYLAVPPWKTIRRQQQAATAVAIKEGVKAEKAATKQAAHEERNRKSAEAAVARKAIKQAEHDARNAARASEREAKKATTKKRISVVDESERKLI